MAHGKLPFDENHSTESAAVIGGAAPARGWIDRMEARADGIWGHVEWTESGRTLMADKAYRWVSPVFTHTKSGNVLQLKSVALTNNPNLIDHLQAMHAQLKTKARDALKADDFAVPGKRTLPIPDAAHVKLAWDMVDRTEGLSDTERAEARRRIRAKAKELGVDTSGWAAHSGGFMEKKAICTALGLAETVDDNAVLTALQTQQARMKDLETELAQLKSTHVAADRVVALQTELDRLKGDRAQEKAVAFVDAAIKGGKPIVAVREQYIAQHVANPAATEALVNGLPSINSAMGSGGTRAAPNSPADGDAMSAEDMAVCAKMGMEPKALAEYRKKMKEKA